MSATDNNPISFNLQSPLNFSFKILRAPSTTYFCQSVKIPDVTLESANVPSPSILVPMAGDHVAFSPLTLTFKVDDDLQNWLEMFNWMTTAGNVENVSREYKIMENNPNYAGYGIYSDLQLFTIDSQKNPSYVVTFERCFPSSLSGPNFDTMNTTVKYISSTVTFKYTKFHFSLP